MDTNTFSFNLVDNLSPKEVIEKFLPQIDLATKGYVSGHIKEYNGEIKSYVRQNWMSILQNHQGEEVNIQEDLGEQNSVDNRYEIYLSVKGLDKYKYRLMLIDYGDIAYPVTVVLVNDLAQIYSDKYRDTFKLDSMKQVEDLMKKIMSSNVIINLIQSLINEARRREQNPALQPSNEPNDDHND